MKRLARLLKRGIGGSYKDLWRQAERDRRAADAALAEITALVVDLLKALDVGDHPRAEIRGEMRKLERVVARLDRAATRTADDGGGDL